MIEVMDLFLSYEGNMGIDLLVLPDIMCPKLVFFVKRIQILWQSHRKCISLHAKNNNI